MSFSYWEQKTFFADTDVAVIGSGITGLQAALHLKQMQPHLRMLVLEKGILPEGASTRNAGFACFGSTAELLSDLETTSETDLFALVEKRWRGLQKLRQTVGDEYLHYQPSGSHEVFDEEADFEKCAQKIDFFNKNLLSLTKQPNVFRVQDDKIADFGFKTVKHLIFNRLEGVVDTGKMMQCLLAKARQAGIEVLNGLKVLSLQSVDKGVILVLQGGIILRVRKVIVATNGFAAELLPGLDVVPARGQVLVTSPLKDLPLKGSFHYDTGYYYFRELDGRVLLGGGRNLDFQTEQTSKPGLTDLVQDKLEDLLRKMILPGRSDYKIDYRWSGIMGFGSEKAPLVKKVSEHIFCAVKMQGMGVAIGSLAGEEVALLVAAEL